MKRSAALLAGLVGGALAAVVLRRRRTEQGAGPRADPRAEELRAKLAQARETAVDEDEFEAAGMAGEALIEEPPRTEGDEADVAEARRRVHEEARAAAEEMRRAGGDEPRTG